MAFYLLFLFPKNLVRGNPHHCHTGPARPPKGHILLPYMGDITEGVYKKITKTGVSAHVHPQNAECNYLNIVKSLERSAATMM